MVGLDAVGFQNVGIDGTLGQEGDAVQLAGFFFKHADELAADDLALLFGVGHAGQLIQEAVRGVHVDQVRLHLLAEDLDDLFGLALAEQAMVDVDAGELLADGTDQQSRDDRGVHAAGEGEQDLLVTDLLAQSGELLLDEGLGQSRGVDALHGFGTHVGIGHIFDSFHSGRNSMWSGSADSITARAW